MAEIKIKVAEPQTQSLPVPPAQENPNVLQPAKPKSALKMDLKIRRSLDGSVMIFDHKNIDIIISPQKMKVVSFAKGDFSDFAYAAQNRMFEFLVKKGVIDPTSIRGGHVYGSFEGTIQKPSTDIPVDQIVILNVGKWMEEERPQMEFDKHYEEYFTDYLTEPEEDDATELGEVPQAEEKGTIPKKQIRRYVGGWW